MIHSKVVSFLLDYAFFFGHSDFKDALNIKGLNDCTFGVASKAERKLIIPESAMNI